MPPLRLTGFFKPGARQLGEPLSRLATWPHRLAEIREAPIDTRELRDADRRYLNDISGNSRLGIL